jgi:hypothetical protein
MHPFPVGLSGQVAQGGIVPGADHGGRFVEPVITVKKQKNNFKCSMVNAQW